MSETLAVLVCEDLEKEVRAALEGGDFSDLMVLAFSCTCEQPPEGWPEVQVAGAERGIWLLGPCCPSTPSPVPKGVRVVHLEECAHLFLSPPLAARYKAQGGLLLTCGRVRRWLAQIERSGQGEDMARRLVGSVPTGLLLLDSGLDPACHDHLERLAGLLGLPAERLPVGLEHLRLYLAGLLWPWQLRQEQSRSQAALSEAIRRSADHATALDLIGNLSRMMSEREAIRSIVEVFTLLFAPTQLVYLPLFNGQPGALIHVYPREAPVDREVVLHFLQDQRECAWLDDRDGFFLRIEHQEECLGLLLAEGLAMPQYREHFLYLARIVGRVCGLAVANARTFQRMKEAEAKVRHLAYHDSLTGLPNRIFFRERLAAALAQARRHERRLALLMMDLDGFKQVNDTLGHAAGDQLLAQVGQRLSSLVRQEDLVARMGGDEFVVLLTEIREAEDAGLVARRIVESLKRPFSLDGEVVRVGVSIGIALFPEEGQDADTLLRHADMAMYQVKESRSGGYRLYGSSCRPGA